MKRYINLWMTAMCVLFLTACSTDMEFAQSDTITNISVGAFPAFASDGMTTRSNVGNYDAGKSAWASGDEILVKVTDPANSDALVGTSTLTYDGTTWSWSNLILQTVATATVTAYYAPAYEWSNATPGTLVLKSVNGAGTGEYLTCTATDVTLANGISINFSDSRTYSRLRIAARANTALTVTMPALTPAGTTNTLADETVSVSTDADGNAYLYGTWTASAAITVKAGEATIAGTTIPTAGTTDAKSYVLMAYTQCDDHGAGTADDPYRIYNYAQLQDMKNRFLDKYFKLVRDIDCPTDGTFTPIGNTTVGFSGTFDGDGHTIRNLKLGKSDDNSALFGATENATIRNLTLTDPSTAATEVYNTAALVAYAISATTISNCHVCVSDGFTGSIQGAASKGAAGGLIGFSRSDDTRLLGCSSAISVTGYKVGGLIGVFGSNFVIVGCRSTGNVTGVWAGGLVGTNSFFQRTPELYIVGSYATGTVIGTTYAGGLVGNYQALPNTKATILSSYATGSVSGSTGGSHPLVGNNEIGSDFKLHYVCSTLPLSGTNGVGGGAAGTIEVSCDVAPAEIYGKITMSGAETEFNKLNILGEYDNTSEYPDYDVFYDRNYIRNILKSSFSTLGGSGVIKLSDIWKQNGTGAPKLWWEK